MSRQERKIHIMPIEPIPARYSADWYRWWPKKLREGGLECMMHTPRTRAVDQFKITDGEFLDVTDTHVWKSEQLLSLIDAVKRGEVGDNDVVLFLDGWNPAVTSLSYIRAGLGLKFRIVLVLHAGTWDSADFLSRMGMRSWGKYVEAGWMEAADRILVATEFHKDLLMKFVMADISQKVLVTGFPLELGELDKYRIDQSEKKNWVVFPHRFAPEKDPQFFNEVAIAYSKQYPNSGVEWIRTKSMCEDKEEYYRALAFSRVSFSSAHQETWGIAMLESWYLGATPVVPDRLSYRELYPDASKYSSVDEAVQRVRLALSEQCQWSAFAPSRDPRDCWPMIIQALEAV